MASKAPLFTVFPPNRSSPTTADTPFVLIRDAWDDFGYKTQYALYYSKDGTRLGDVKILQFGQRETVRGVLPDGPIGRLSTDFCSLGQTLDYYERVAALPSQDRERLLVGLRDALANPSRAHRFKTEPGWRISVRRDMGDEGEFEQLASVLLGGDYSSLAGISLELTFRPAEWQSALVLQFEAPEEANDFFGRRSGGARNRFRLPRRAAVITGRNGSGKSTLLARLARVLHASQSGRQSKQIRALGEIDPPNVGFTRIVAVSYSAFDSFEVPGVSRGERRQIAKDLKSGSGRYIFCGLRDIAGELEAEFDQIDDLAELNGSISLDRRPSTQLKPIEVLADEFERIVSRITELDRTYLLNAVSALIMRDPSFNDVETHELATLMGDSPRQTFLGWSTGHKIVLHILASLVAYTEPRSIVLFDEPESHLHPPLLAALMHGIRYVLEERDAFAVIATHSPVVAQETLSRHVHVVRRSGDATTISSPIIETFGESIGEITDEVFGLNTDATDYHEILQKLLEQSGSLEAVERMFAGGLSLQARAYLMTLAAGERTES